MGNTENRCDVVKAATSGDPEHLRTAIRRYPHHIDRQVNGTTPMHQAARHGNLEAINILLEAGSRSLTAIDKYGKTPVVAAVVTPYVVGLAIVKRLMHEAITRGYDLRSLLEMEYTVASWKFTNNIFHKLNFDEQLEILDYFLRLGIPEILVLVHRKNTVGKTPLLLATDHIRANLKIVERYLEHSLDSLDIPCNDGWTPVQMAAYHRNSDIVVLLRALGATVPINPHPFLSTRSTQLMTEPIPDEVVMEIRHRFHFRKSLLSLLFDAMNDHRTMVVVSSALRCIE